MVAIIISSDQAFIGKSFQIKEKDTRCVRSKFRGQRDLTFSHERIAASRSFVPVSFSGFITRLKISTVSSRLWMRPPSTSGKSSRSKEMSSGNSRLTCEPIDRATWENYYSINIHYGKLPSQSPQAMTLPSKLTWDCHVTKMATRSDPLYGWECGWGGSGVLVGSTLSFGPGDLGSIPSLRVPLRLVFSSDSIHSVK